MPSLPASARRFVHVDGVNHEGKPVAVATDTSGALHYTVRRGGFERSAAAEVPGADGDAPHWEPFRPLPLPGAGRPDPLDPSVAERDEREFRLEPSASADGVPRPTHAHRSRFDTHALGRPERVRLISHAGVLHVFRQLRPGRGAAAGGMLAVDRFVLDGLTNRLNPRLDVRFRRSRQKFAPDRDANGTSTDSLDFRDANDEPFLAPSTEASFVGADIAPGRWDVAIVPSAEHDRFRWHVAWVAASGRAFLASVASTPERLFDLRDRAGRAGFSLTRIDVDERAVAGHPALASFDKQAAIEGEDGETRLVRTSTHLMLTLPLATPSGEPAGTSALELDLAADGTLASDTHLAHDGAARVLRADRRDVALPLDTIDGIRGVGLEHPLTVADVTSLRRDTADTVRVDYRAPDGSAMDEDAPVRLDGTAGLDGRFSVRGIVVGQLSKALDREHRTLQFTTNLADPMPPGLGLRLVTARGRVLGRVTTADHRWRTRRRSVSILEAGFDAPAGSRVECVDAFEIESAHTLGRVLEQPAPDATARFAGQVNGVDRLNDGRLRVHAFDHGLAEGAEVRLDGLPGLDGTFEVFHGEEHVLLGARWPEATATDLDAVRGARRGLVLERGERARLPVPSEHALGGGTATTLELRLRASGECTLLEQGPLALALGGRGRLELRYRHGRTLLHADAPALLDGRWHHLALVHTRLDGYRIVVDGREIAVRRRGRGASVVRLDDAGENRVAAIKALREVLKLDLRAAAELVDAAPTTLREHVEAARAEAMRAELERAAPGLTASVHGGSSPGSDVVISDVGDDRSAVIRAIADALGQGPADAARRRPSIADALVPGLDDAVADALRTGLERAGASVELWRDGERLHASVDARSLAPTPLALGGRGKRLALADVRLWSRALDTAEIDARRHLPLNGRELGLVGLWRLGAILEGEPRELVDHSPSARSGECGPGAWIDSRRIDGILGDGVPVVRFENPALVGVVSGASYEEIVELRAERDGRPLTADEIAAVLSARFEGRRSRHAETLVGPDDFVTHGTTAEAAKPAGWVRLTTRVTIPDDVSLVRAFGLAVADGERVTSLAVRRLRLRRVSDSISLAVRSAPPLPAPTLAADAAADSAANATAPLDELRTLEIEEVERLRRLRAIDADLALLGDVDALGRRVTAARDTLRAHEADFRRATVRLNDERNNPLNYWCYLTLADRVLRAYTKRDEEGKARRQILRSKPTTTRYSNYRWAYDWQNGRLHSGYESLVMTMYGSAWDFRMFAVPSNTRVEQRWDVAPDVRVTDPGPAHASILLTNREWKRVPFPNGEHGAGGFPATAFPGVFPFRLGVAIAPGGQVETPYSRIGARVRERQRIGGHVGAARTEHRRLKALFDGHDARRAALTEERANVVRRLGEIADRLGSLRARLDGLSRSSVSEDGVALAPGLRAHALGGVDPVGGYALADRCDGALVLSALDADGALVETRYEAAATAARFERWQRSGLRHCADLGKRGAIRLDPPVGGSGADATLEAWVRLPWVGHDGAGTMLADLSSGDYLWSDNAAPRFSLSLNGGGEALVETDWPEPGWHHLCVVVGGSGPRATTRLYVDGVLRDDARAAAEERTAALIEDATDEAAKRALREALENGRYRPEGAFERVGNHASNGYGVGMLAEVRVWDIALTDEEVEVNSRVTLTGREPGLVHYLPLDTDGASRTANSEARLEHVDFDAVRRPWSARPGRLGGETATGARGVVSLEYAATRVDPDSGARGAMMRRLYAGVVDGAVTVLAHQRVETLEMVWIGNAQFAPTLLGYIEGAPPIPTENLTMNVGLKSYTGATSVQLTATSSVDLSWQRDQKAGLGLDMSVFYGRAGKIFIFPGTEVGDYKFGFRGDLSLSYGFLNSSEVTASSGLSLTDRLELRGAIETEAHFTHLGRRFVPKNTGYALVVSSVADVYITRLPTTGTMVSYEVVPSPEIPPDVNTITFLINPAYTMAGSLDGLTGSRATSERFFAHVPAMRAQLGSRYPASYMRVDEAYALKARIERDDREREAFFANFDSRLVDGASLDRQVDGDVDEEALEGSAEAQRRTLEAQAGESEAKADAAAGLAAWQTKMERLSLAAGKRDILNTYVWDADGGLRSESQDFADTVTHTIGGTFSLSGRLGFQGEGSFLGTAAGLTALATVHLEQKMTRSRTARRAMTLDVDLSGVESRGITDHRDRPLVPGEKVDRYRFMSFYLAGDTAHFDTFFDQVVDPEWFASNDEEARALRQIDRSRANKCWRVMHRVTYVERPALLDLGADVRPLSGPPATPATTLEDVDARLDTLDRSVRSLQRSVRKLGRATTDEEEG